MNNILENHDGVNLYISCPVVPWPNSFCLAYRPVRPPVHGHGQCLYSPVKIINIYIPTRMQYNDFRWMGY